MVHILGWCIWCSDTIILKSEQLLSFERAKLEINSFRVWKGRLVNWQTQILQKRSQVAFDPNQDPGKNKPRQLAVIDTPN